MFDIGFWEITVIAVVALLVVGPKELPTLLRTVGAMVKKVRRFVREAKADLDEEINKVDELKRRMAKEAEIAELHKNIELDAEKPAIPVRSSTGNVKGAGETRQASGPEKSTDGQSAEASVQPPYGSNK
jgi:sec-independent protein translocase protein TatB